MDWLIAVNSSASWVFNTAMTSSLPFMDTSSGYVLGLYPRLGEGARG
jgi:hypothetical protein